MKLLQRSVLGLLIVAILSVACSPSELSNDVLVFSKTEGFRHESIEAGIAMFEELGQTHGFHVEATEDSEYFTQDILREFKVVVFLNTTLDVLNPSQQIEFQRFIQAGGGFFGVHAAADTEYDWPWYGQLVGAYFNGHPNNPNVRDAAIDRIDSTHLSTKHLPGRWERSDEWYNYKNINPNIQVVLNLDETSYEGGTNGDEHPIAWYHEFDGGRSFYTGGGHTDESFQDPAFVQHVWGGLQWTVGDGKPVDYKRPTVMPEENRFHKKVLASYFEEPMELDLLPDGRIVFIERKGKIKVYDPEAEFVETVYELEVFSELEDGLMGIAIDPNYASNKRIYLCYSDPEESVQNISRFVFDPDSPDVLSDEIVILTVPTQRDECCHSAGSVEFGPDGNLWVSFGDNTNPHESNGLAPIDAREGRGPFDARKSSSNTNDLRGGIIRITVQEDGSYTIPDGNLFKKDGSEGRPEIYVMGCRNPFRFSIDAKTGYLYWGDVGPDGQEDVAERGPRGYDEVNQAKGPGYFGWPLFIADNKPYNAYDFATDQSGDAFDPQRPVNDSPFNTGSQDLPAAQPAMIYYPYAKSSEFPYVGTGGRNAMAGPIFHVDNHPQSNQRYPAYYDGKLFTYDWMRGWMMAVSFDENGDFESMEPFLPSIKWSNLMDVVMGPNGDMFMLEYGTRWFSANTDARLVHLTFEAGNRPPVAEIVTDRIDGALPLEISFDGSMSKDYDGEGVEYSWDFGDGSSGKGEQVTHTYDESGEYDAKLTVTDEGGLSTTQQVKIFAGNTAPSVDIVLSGNSQFYWPQIPITYEVSGNDNEDGEIGGQDMSITLDYIERGYDITEIAQGHQSPEGLDIQHEGLTLIDGSDCFSCHKTNETSVGPSYMDIYQKYEGDATAIDYLSEKIRLGGGGVWGETAMAAHPDLSDDVAKKMAEYIMTVGDEDDSERLDPSGTKTLQIPEGKEDGGRFILQASYQDKGSENVSSLSAHQNIILRPATLAPEDVSQLESASRFTLSPEMSPFIQEEMEVIIVNNEATIVFQNVDLTSVSALMATFSLPPQFTGGGTVALHLDDPDADPVSSQGVKTAQGPFPISQTTFTIEETGIHDLIFKASAEDANKAVGILFQITLLPSVAG